MFQRWPDHNSVDDSANMNKYEYKIAYFDVNFLCNLHGNVIILGYSKKAQKAQNLNNDVNPEIFKLQEY